MGVEGDIPHNHDDNQMHNKSSDYNSDTSAAAPFDEAGINEEEQQQLMDGLKEIFQNKFTSVEETPSNRGISIAAREFRYTQRFFVEYKELPKYYFVEYIRPHKRGAIVKLCCKGSFSHSFVYIVFPVKNDDAILAYRSNYFREGDDEKKILNDEKTVTLITKFDDILSKHLPKGLSDECAIDARFLIYFLRNYGNQTLDGLPEIRAIAKDVKVTLPVKESKIELAGRQSANQEENSAFDCLGGDYVMYFEDEACRQFLTLNETFWNDSIASVSPKYHDREDENEERRKMSIKTIHPDPDIVKKKKIAGSTPFLTSVRLRPSIQDNDIGEGWYYLASLVILLSKSIVKNHGEVYLARCVRACYGLKNFEAVMKRGYGAQPYTLSKLATLRGACFMARSKTIYIDHTDLEFRSVTMKTIIQEKIKKNNTDIEQPLVVDDEEEEITTLDDTQMTIVPITHDLGSLMTNNNGTLKLQANSAYGLSKPFLVCLSHETYGGHSPALNNFGSYISQIKLDRSLTPSSEMTMLESKDVETIRNDWKTLLTQDKRLPGIAIHVTENGSTNITYKEWKENGHIKWMEQYSFHHAIGTLIAIIIATWGAWETRTGAFHFIVALAFIDLVEQEVALIGPLRLLFLGREAAGHYQVIEKGTHIICIILLGLVEAFSDIESTEAFFKPYLILSCVTVGLMIIMPLIARLHFKKAKNGGMDFDEVMARDGSLECVLTPQDGGAFRICDRKGAYGLGLLQAQSPNQVFVHNGSLGTSNGAPGANMQYWIPCG